MDCGSATAAASPASSSRAAPPDVEDAEIAAAVDRRSSRSRSDPLSGARVLDHDAQQRLQQARELELARDALRGGDHRQDVELLGAHGEGDGGGDRLARGEVGVALVELLHLGVGAPAEVAGAGLAQVGVGGREQAARAVKPRGELAGDGLVLDEAALSRRGDGLLVEPHRLRFLPAEPGDLGADQGVFVEEVLGAARGPRAELPLALEQLVRGLPSGGAARAPREPRSERAASESAW